MIDILLESGIRGAFFGIESFHGPSLSTIGKPLPPKKSWRLLEKFVLAGAIKF